MLLLEQCSGCDGLLHPGWVACPFCGIKIDGVMNSQESIIVLAQKVSCNTCNSTCNKKAMKSTCCGKHKRKNKFCKRCPEKFSVIDLAESVQ